MTALENELINEIEALQNKIEQLLTNTELITTQKQSLIRQNRTLMQKLSMLQDEQIRLQDLLKHSINEKNQLIQQIEQENITFNEILTKELEKLMTEFDTKQTLDKVSIEDLKTKLTIYELDLQSLKTSYEKELETLRAELNSLKKA